MPDPARWLNDNIPGWKNLHNREKKAIRDFAVLWSFFELNSTSQYGRPNATPQNIVRAVGDLEQELSHLHLEFARSYFADRYIVENGYTEHWFHLGLYGDFVNMVRHGLVGDDKVNCDTLLSLLLIANRLRNNFLHGEKAKYNFAGQFDNFTQANNVLMYALELWPIPQAA